MNVTEAEKKFPQLVEQVYVEGISVDLERDNQVIARLAPVEPQSTLTIGELNHFLRTLPSLDDDTTAFSRDVRAVRMRFPPEVNPWD